MKVALVAAIGLACVASATPRTARADDAPPPDLAQAKERFDRGLVLFDRGEFAGALAEFEQAHHASGRWELLYNIAVTQKRLYRYDASVRTFIRYLAEGGAEVTAERRAQVEAEQAETVKLTGQVTVVVDGPPAQLEIDGETEPGWTTPVDHAILVRGGAHTLVASRGDAEPATKKFELVSGDAITLHLTLAPKAEVARVGYLAIASAPTGAIIRDGDLVLGPTPWSGPVPHGTHTLAATAPGYRASIQSIHVDVDEHRDVRFDLAPLPPPVYRRWYVLAGVGAAVVGAVVATYVLTRSTPDVVIHYPR